MPIPQGYEIMGYLQGIKNRKIGYADRKDKEAYHGSTGRTQ